MNAIAPKSLKYLAEPACIASAQMIDNEKSTRGCITKGLREAIMKDHNGLLLRQSHVSRTGTEVIENGKTDFMGFDYSCVSTCLDM